MEFGIFISTDQVGSFNRRSNEFTIYFHSDSRCSIPLMAANSSIFPMFYLIAALISLSFPKIIGSSMEDADFTALLPFGSASGIGSFTRLPQCGGRGGSSSSPINSCRPIGHLNCNGKSYPRYLCSPPVTSSTEATLLTNDFSEGGDGGAPSECDEKYHDNSELVVALSTGWYNKGSRCGKMIRIRARNGKSVLAKVVDECDSVNGCDSEHVNDPPCPNNILNGSEAVWAALELYGGEQPVTWSDA